MSTPLQCSYIGLGAMGIAMAGHISKRLEEKNWPRLLVFNRTETRAHKLAEKYPVEVATSLDKIASSSDIIFSCLLNDAVVTETYDKMLPNLKKGVIVVESSTISPTLAQEIAAKIKKVGAIYLACPVMGPPVKAESAELTVLMAGENSVRPQVVDLLIPAIGKKVIELGEDVAESLRLKLCGNYFVTSVVEMVAEGMTLGEASGVGQDKVKELLDCVFPNTLLGIYADRMLRNTYKDQIAFPISSIKKDLTHITKMASDNNVKLPITEAFLVNANKVHSDHGDYDLTSIVGNLRLEAGLDFDLENRKEKSD